MNKERDPFTDKRLKVVRGMVAGLSDREIADRMMVGVETVRRHRGALYNELGIPSRGEVGTRWMQAALVSAAEESGHISPEEADEFRERQRLPTPRQLEVVLLTWQGYTNKQIREALGISQVTVSVHLQQAVKRAGVNNRAELFDFLGLTIR